MGEDIQIEIRRDDECARQARLAVAERLEGVGDAEQRYNILLVVSELITNAYQHGDGTIELKLALEPHQATIEVVDQGPPGRIRIVEQQPEMGGWGLRIVDELASQWGVFEGTTHVWAKLPLS